METKHPREAPHPLKIPVILSSLFSHMALPELKIARLVSKLWHYEATHFLLQVSKITTDFKSYITCDKTTRLANLDIISSLRHLSPQDSAPNLAIKLPQFNYNLLPELQLDSAIKPSGDSIANLGHEIDTLFDLPGPEIWENFPEIIPWSRIHFILQDVRLLLNTPQLREVTLFAPINTDSTYALFLAVLKKLGVLPKLEKLEVTIVFGASFLSKLQDVSTLPEVVSFNALRKLTVSIIHDPADANIFLQRWIPNVFGGMGGHLRELILKMGSDLDTLFLHDVRNYWPTFYSRLKSISVLYPTKDIFQWVTNFANLTKLEVATRPEMEPDLEKNVENVLTQYSATLKSFEVKLHRPRGEKNLAIKLPKLGNLRKLRISIGAGDDGTWSKDWVRRGRQDCGVESDRTATTVTFYSDQVNKGVEIATTLPKLDSLGLWTSGRSENDDNVDSDVVTFSDFPFFQSFISLTCGDEDDPVCPTLRHLFIPHKSLVGSSGRMRGRIRRMFPNVHNPWLTGLRRGGGDF